MARIDRGVKNFSAFFPRAAKARRRRCGEGRPIYARRAGFSGTLAAEKGNAVLRPFGFATNLHGVTVMPDRIPLHDACLSSAEVDIEIIALKIDLDRVAKLMKAVIAEKRIIPFVRKTDG